MTDAQMLQNLLAVYEAMVIISDFFRIDISESVMPGLKEVIAELRRRIELEGSK